MSQKSQSDGGQKHFAVGQGLLAAAETLNFSMKDQHPGRQMGGMGSGMGVGGGGGVDGHNTKGLMSPRGGGGNLGSTMKLFASLGLSPSDLDALAEIPEEDISVETLPHILMQLKRRKADSGDRRAASMSSDVAYQGGRDSWDEGQGGRMGSSSMGQGSSRAAPSTDFGFSSMQNVSPGRGYGMNYSAGGDGSRERLYSGLSRQDSYGGLGMGPSQSNSVFMQRRKGSPSNGKVQDFLGVSPTMFPHVCSLCDFDVHSIMEWNQHANGLRHAENRRMLLEMYPEWDPGMSSGRGRGVLNTPNMSAGLLGAAPMSAGGAGGMSSSWGGGPGVSGQDLSGQTKLRGRVVVVKYDRKPLSNNTLFAYTKPFGRLQEHLVLKNKAFLEMSSHEEAMDMVNYYQQNQASLYGKPLNFYLSKRLLVIEKDERASERSMDRPVDRGMDRPMRNMKSHDSKVVFFSNLPRDDGEKMELLTVAGRFGSVDKHLFLTDKAFVQLGTVEDAEMLVKYYSVNPLTIKGRSIRLNICTKYKTLNIKWKQGASGDAQQQRGGRGNTAASSRARSSSEHRTSRSSSSSRTREDDKKEKSEEKSSSVADKDEEDEEEEEVSGVVQGGEDEGAEEAEEDDHGTDGGDAGGAESGKEEEPSGEQEEQAPDGAPENVGGAETKEEVEPESTEAAASTDEQEKKQEANAEAAESSEPADGDGSDHPFDEDFMENMEDFVTLDELGEEEEEVEDDDSIDQTKRGGMRVVNIVGFRRGYNFLNELLGLARPFGKVIRHLVLDLRPEAFIQFATEDEARAMAKFYNSNVTASVCGRPVRVSHSMSYPTIQCGSSRVVYIGQIPSSKYSDESVLKLAKPFGKIRKYFLNRMRKECFIEMYNAEDAEKMAEEYKAKPPRFNGKRLTIYVSRKYRQLKHGHQRPVSPKREKSATPERTSEEPPTKKLKEEKPEQEEEEKQQDEQPQQQQQEEQQQQQEQQEEQQQEQRQEAEVSGEEKTEEPSAEQVPTVTKISCKEEPEEQMEIGQNGQTEAPPPAPAAEVKPSTASLPLPPFDPESPIGVEYVKMGYYCRVCFLFYSNEETAKKTHCSSQGHYDKLKKHLEKEQNKPEKKKLKKTTTS
ncbi:matrin 3-like 1.2 [Salarias fasciatus]|uniref:Matrin-3-like n=1 Tax=Salarias fasciatus TaxID=181472 RepID=A0A672GDC2_SALFA|nr:matrin-3-like [Salarias fasciatus]XP_029962357.1 matrin-3-like [Salarias fasciatus]